MSDAPKEEGAALELRAKPRPVTRLNRKVVAVILIIIGLVVLLAFTWGLHKPRSSTIDSAPEVHTSERIARAEGLAALPKDYTGVPQLGPPAGELGRPMLKAEQEAGLPQLPERSSFRPDAEEQALRAQRLKEQNEAEEAAKAGVVVPLKSKSKQALTAALPESAGADRRSPSADFLQALNTVSSHGAGPDDPNKQVDKEAFVNQKTDPEIYASGTVQRPRSPYQLMAGSVISAALVTGINSDLPGQVIASVTENVFDSVAGRELLIPQGSRLLGHYDSQVAWGQSRMLLVWTRLIMPDGSSIVLDRLPGVDTAGYAGLQDGVDWHWRRIFAGAAVSTVLGAGAELAAPRRSNSEGDVIIATREGIQDTVNQVGQELTRRNLNIQPTLTGRPGLPVKVIVGKDLVLRPYGREQG